MDYDSDETYCSVLESDISSYRPCTEKNLEHRRCSQRIIDMERLKKKNTNKQINITQKVKKTKPKKKNNVIINKSSKRGRKPKYSSENKYVNEEQQINKITIKALRKKFYAVEQCMQKCKDIISDGIFKHLKIKNTQLENINYVFIDILKRISEQNEKLLIERVCMESHKTEATKNGTYNSILTQVEKISNMLKKIEDIQNVEKNSNKTPKNKLSYTENDKFLQYIEFKNSTMNIKNGGKMFYCFHSFKELIKDFNQNKNKDNEFVYSNDSNILNTVYTEHPYAPIPVQENQNCDKIVSDFVTPQNTVEENYTENLESQDIFESPQLLNDIDLKMAPNYRNLNNFDTNMETYNKNSRTKSFNNEVIDLSQRTINLDLVKKNSCNILTQFSNESDKFVSINKKIEDDILNSNDTKNPRKEIKKNKKNIKHRIEKNEENSQNVGMMNKKIQNCEEEMTNNHSTGKKDFSNLNLPSPIAMINEINNTKTKNFKISQNKKQINENGINSGNKTHNTTRSSNLLNANEKDTFNAGNLKLLENYNRIKEKNSFNYGWLKSVKTTLSPVSGDSEILSQEIILPKEFWEDPYAKIPENWLGDFCD